MLKHFTSHWASAESPALRIHFVVWAVSAVCCLIGLGIMRPAAAGDAAPRPNIILVLSDDVGYGDAGCTGNPVIKTPNIDRMYNEGVRFSDFHVSPTCSPTRSSIMAGRHEFHSGVTHTTLERERLSLKATTIAQVLKSSGYTTGVFGKWHLGDEDPYQPRKRGFDEAFIHGSGGIGQAYPGQSGGDAPGNKYFDPVILHNDVFEKQTGYCTDIFFGQAQKWIEEVQGKQPFFAYITPNAAHAPLDCPKQYEEMYTGKVEPNVAKFFGMITNIDDNIGRLLATLKKLGIDDNTLVVYMNDNGGYGPACRVYNAGMKGNKGTAHNGGTRAISLWRWPGHLQPATCDKLAAHIDLFPTFAELAGAKVPDDVSGRLEGFSLVPLLKNPQAAWHDERMLFTHVGRWLAGEEPKKYGLCSVRWQQYLLVREMDHWQLYDLLADPGEKTDLGKQQLELVARLDKAYDAWWAATLPLLENEQAYKTAPQQMPFFERYYRQYAGPGPNNVPPKSAEK